MKNLNIILSTIVRHDEDVIIQFIENNLSHVSKIYLYVHNPYPRIIQLLSRYINEDRIVIEHINSDKFKQEEFVNEIYNFVLSQEKNIDIYFHLDSDEFIIDLDEVKRKIKPGYLFKSPSVILYNSIEGNTNNYSIHNDSKWNKTNYYFSEENCEDLRIGDGQHNWSSISNNKLQIIELEKPFYIHFPWRSIFQTVRKITEVWSYKLTNDSYPTKRFNNYINSTFNQLGEFDINNLWKSVNGYTFEEIKNFPLISNYIDLKLHPEIFKNGVFYIKNEISPFNLIESQYENLLIIQKKIMH